MGDPLVLVPGLDGTGLLFYRQVPLLARRYTVTTHRLRDSAERFEELVADLDASVDQSGRGVRVTLVGESFGGALALLVVVVLVSALAVVRDDGADQGFVDTRPTTEPLPLLGWPGDGWWTMGYLPMATYAIAPAEAHPGVGDVSLSVSPAEMVGFAVPTEDVEELTVLGRPAVLGFTVLPEPPTPEPQSSDRPSGVLLLMWDPAPGYTADRSWPAAR